MNRATADNQSAQAEEEGLEPTKEWVKDVVDEIIAEEFSSPDLELHWLDEDADAAATETALEGRVKLGALTLNEMREHLGLDPYANAAADRPMVLTPTGYVPIEANADGAKDNAGGNGPAAQANAPDAKTVIQKAAADDPKHPGWPAGTPGGIGGQFRPKDGDGGEGAGNSPDVAAAVANPGVQYAARETGTQTDLPGDASALPGGQSSSRRRDTESSEDHYAAVTVERYDKTNDPLIDRTTDILFQTLVQCAEIVDRAQILLGKAGPTLYGTLVHGAFATKVRQMDLPGIGQGGVEQSFSLRDVVSYGSNGSIRTDVIMRDVDSHVIAIWDVKTGNAELTDERRKEIRNEVGVFSDVPVIELHVRRGVR